MPIRLDSTFHIGPRLDRASLSTGQQGRFSHQGLACGDDPTGAKNLVLDLYPVAFVGRRVDETNYRQFVPRIHSVRVVVNPSWEYSFVGRGAWERWRRLCFDLDGCESRILPHYDAAIADNAQGLLDAISGTPARYLRFAFDFAPHLVWTQRFSVLRLAISTVFDDQEFSDICLFGRDFLDYGLLCHDCDTTYFFPQPLRL
jgi:hypothetical protein